MGVLPSPRAVPPVRVAFLVFGAVMLAAGAGVACKSSQDGNEPGLDPTSGVDLARSLARLSDQGTPVYHSLRGDAWRPIIGEENWQTNIVEDPIRTAVTDPEFFLEFASAFQDFPLYWVDLEFQGLPLTGITRSYRLHVTPPENHISIMYGTCEPPPREGGCRVPLQIRVEPYCDALRGGSAPAAPEDADLQVRGVSVQFAAGALWLWTGDVFVRISAYPEERMLAAADALVAANGQGPGTADEPLPPLDEDCS